MIEKYKSDVFVETGTYKGNTASRAQKLFDEVHTIEVDPNLAESARRKLDCNVYCGESVEVLPDVIRKIDPSKSVTFWLDSHADGGGSRNWMEGSFSDYQKCPVYEELYSVFAFWNGDMTTILIDDLRIINGNGWGRSDLSEDSIFEYVRSWQPQANFSYADGHVENDVLVIQC